MSTPSKARAKNRNGFVFIQTIPFDLFLTPSEAGQLLVWTYVTSPEDTARPGRDVYVSIPVPFGHRTASLELYGTPADEENEALVMFGVKRTPTTKPRMTVLVGQELATFQQTLTSAISEAKQHLVTTGLDTVKWGEDK